MQYKTLLAYETIAEFKKGIADLQPGLWLIDLDPRADALILGPYDSISEAHEQRDFLWHYGDKFGRYMWLLSRHSCEVLKAHSNKIQHIEVGIDTLPMEIVGMRIKVEDIHEWIKVPRRRVVAK
jgi:hypothetical protein